MDQILSGIVGAVLGALITGVIAWRLQRSQKFNSRNWDISLKISEILGSILSAYTPDTLKTRDDVCKLQNEWGVKARELHLLGFGGGTNDPLSQVIDDYFEALISYIDGNMQRGALEHKRAYAKEKAKELMNKFTA